MVEIPMFIFLSQSVREICPNIEEACKRSLHKPYMSDDIIHTVLGILGIKSSGYEKARDLLSTDFDIARKRMYQGKNYDEFWKLQKVTREV